MRAHIFHTGFWAISALFAIVILPLGLIPTRKPVVTGLWLYTRAITGWLRACGVRIRFDGFDKLKGAEGAVVAAKHQSYADGITLVSQAPDLAYVIGDHMLRFPLIGFILKRAEAVVVDDAAGRRADAISGFGFKAGCERLRRDDRDVLIFPEGGMSAVGRKKRYRRGVFKLYQELERPVFPVATNMGCFWPEQERRLHPGEARIVMLDPIPPGLDQKTFMDRLETAIETKTAELVHQARAGSARRARTRRRAEARR